MIATRPSTATCGAALAAFLLPVAYAPFVLARFWSPKLAVLVVLGAVGLTALPRLLKSDQRRSALLALAFAAAAVAATVLSPEPIRAVFGIYNWGTGLVFVLGCVGLWALGSSVPARERSLVIAALIAGIGVSSVVGVLQAIDAVREPTLMSRGRAFGLSGNAGHLASLAAAMAVVAGAGARRSLRWVVVAVAAAMVVQITGTRSALAVVLAAALVGAIRAGAKRGAILVVVVMLGILFGSVLTDLGGSVSATSRSSTRGTELVSGGGSTNVRVAVWQYSVSAIRDRPLLGHGPGRFRAATGPDRSLRVAQLEGSDVLYTDAHNIVVEHLVTTGVVGAALLVVWLVVTFGRARGPAAWFAAGLALMALAQPMSSGTTPLLFLTLGVAGSVGSGLPRAPGAILGVAALLAAGSLIVGDARLADAVRHRDNAAARTADTLLRPWPRPASIRAGIARIRHEDEGTSMAAAIHWRKVALRRDPTDPILSVLLANDLREAGRVRLAERHYKAALRNNPWSIAALKPLAELAVERCDDTAARRYLSVISTVNPEPQLTRPLRQRLRDCGDHRPEAAREAPASFRSAAG